MSGLKLNTLTEKERLVLALWICGQTAKQSAIYLKKSNRTIEFHRERIKCKLGVYSATELHLRAVTCPEFMQIQQKGVELIRDSSDQLHLGQKTAVVKPNLKTALNPSARVH